MAHHQLFEWERRRFDGDDGLPIADAERLVRAASKQEAILGAGQRAFDFHRHTLGARNLVGMVSAAGVSCEILPKVDRDARGDALSLRRQLVHMLGVAHDLPFADLGAASIGTQQETLLEFLVERFTSMLETAVRRGIPKAYIPYSDDLSALRGRLDVTRQFATLASQPHRIACRYDEFSMDIPVNQVMKAAVTSLHRICRSLTTRRRLGELALVYADVTAVSPRTLVWPKMNASRGMTCWPPLIRFAQMLLGERFQDTSHGLEQGFSLLFDMNVLFERYVEKILRPIAAVRGFQLGSQGGKQPCLLTEEAGAGLFHTRPDLRVFRGGETTYIIDTKWKRLADRGQDARMGVSQADIYQMMAYAQVYQCARLILLYPEHAGLPAPHPVHHRIAANGGAVRLTVATVDLATHSAARESVALLFD